MQMQISPDQKRRLLDAIESRRSEVVEERARHAKTFTGKWSNADEAKAQMLDATMHDLELLRQELNKPTGQIDW